MILKCIENVPGSKYSKMLNGFINSFIKQLIQSHSQWQSWIQNQALALCCSDSPSDFFTLLWKFSIYIKEERLA